MSNNDLNYRRDNGNNDLEEEEFGSVDEATFAAMMVHLDRKNAELDAFIEGNQGKLNNTKQENTSEVIEAKPLAEPKRDDKEKQRKAESAAQQLNASVKKYYYKLKRNYSEPLKSKYPHIDTLFQEFESNMSSHNIRVGSQGFVDALEKGFSGIKWDYPIHYQSDTAVQKVLVQPNSKKVNADNTKVTDSVGAGGKNLKKDVLSIQKALHDFGLLTDSDFDNQSRIVRNSPPPTVEQDKIDITIEAIRTFQEQVLYWSEFDGNISGPSSPTLANMHAEHMDSDYVQKRIAEYPVIKLKRNIKAENTAKKEQAKHIAAEEKMAEVARIKAIADKPATTEAASDFIGKETDVLKVADALVEYAHYNPAFAKKVIEHYKRADQDNLTYALMNRLSDGELAQMSKDLLNYMLETLTRMFVSMSDYSEPVGRLNTILGNIEIEENLFAALADGAEDKVQEWVQKYWPTNFGLELSAKVGATFGYPVGGDVHGVSHFYKKNEETLALRKYSKIKAGLDTGVSAGAYFKLGSNFGVGGEAGADAEAMLGCYTDLQYEFPLESGDAICAALIQAFKMTGGLKPGPVPISLLTDLAVQALEYMTDKKITPYFYLKNAEMAFGAEGKGTASAQLGLRVGEADSYAKNFGKNEFMPDDAAGKPQNFLLRMLNLAAIAQLGAEVYMGAKMNVLERDPETLNVTKAEAEIFVNGGASANINTPLPLVGLNGKAGIEKKIVTSYEAGKGWQFKEDALVLSTGDMKDKYSPAKELEIGNIDEWDSKDLKDSLKSIKFKQKLASSIIFGRGYKTFQGTFDGLNQLTKNNKKSNGKTFGLSICSNLTLSFDFSKGDFDYIDELLQTVKATEIFELIRDFISTGELPEKFGKFSRAIINDFIQMMNHADLFIAIGGGIAAGVKLSEGLKGRLVIDASANITYQEDIVEYLKNDFDFNDLGKSLKGIMPLRGKPE